MFWTLGREMPRDLAISPPVFPCLLSTEMGQRAQKGIIVPRSIVLLAVDEKARRSADAALHSAHEVVPHPALESPLRNVFDKLRDVETELPGVLHERFL